MGLFSKLFGKEQKTDAPPADPLRAFIDSKLPKNYVSSGKYAVEIQELAGASSAHITLDMLADGSDYSGFGDADYRQLAEMESGYLLTGCLADPPAPVSFVLDLVFGGGRTIRVEKLAGENFGLLTDGEESREISF